MPGSIQSIERAAGILRLLAAEPRRFRLADLARSLGLAKPTVHGILRTLQQAGLVEQDDTGDYRLGAALLHLGCSYLDGNELRTRALSWADPIADLVIATIAVKEGRDVWRGDACCAAPTMTSATPLTPVSTRWHAQAGGCGPGCSCCS